MLPLDRPPFCHRVVENRLRRIREGDPRARTLSSTLEGDSYGALDTSPHGRHAATGSMEGRTRQSGQRHWRPPAKIFGSKTIGAGSAAKQGLSPTTARRRSPVASWNAGGGTAYHGETKGGCRRPRRLGNAVAHARSNEDLYLNNVAEALGSLVPITRRWRRAGRAGRDRRRRRSTSRSWYGSR